MGENRGSPGFASKISSGQRDHLSLLLCVRLFLSLRFRDSEVKSQMYKESVVRPPIYMGVTTILLHKVSHPNVQEHRILTSAHLI
jgi:hypothetical protein